MPYARIERLARLMAITCICWLWLLSCVGFAQFGNPFGGGPGGAALPGGQKEQRPEIIPYIGPAEKIPVSRVLIVGNRAVHESKVRAMLGTREGRIYDPEQVRRDMRALMQSGFFTVQSRTFKKQTDKGMEVTFDLVERPLISYVRFVGNERVKDKKLRQEAGIKEGDPLNRFSVEEAKRRLEDFYESKGYNDVFISIIEGTRAEDIGVTFRINEGQVLRISQATFEGNYVATDARLKTVIESKPGILWFIGGKAKDDQLEQDVDRLTAYYRSLGYFQARVGAQPAIQRITHLGRCTLHHR